jgi:hypothetical protein
MAYAATFGSSGAPYSQRRMGNIDRVKDFLPDGRDAAVNELTAV